MLSLLIRLPPLFFSSATVEAVEADEGKLASQALSVAPSNEGGAGFTFSCRSLYRVCGCQAKELWRSFNHKYFFFKKQSRVCFKGEQSLWLRQDVCFKDKVVCGVYGSLARRTRNVGNACRKELL